MLCQYCNQDRKLIKAHVIPEAFFRPLRKGKTPPRLYSQGKFPKKSPIGVYDKTILCLECEQKFHKWDDYAQKLLLQEFDSFSPRKSNGEILAFVRENYDYKKLKLFFISLLWRSSISNQDYYSQINLDSLEDSLKTRLENDKPGNADEYSTILARFDNRTGQLSMLNPHPQDFNGLEFIQFYLTGYIAYVKIDNRPIKGILRNFQLVPNQKLYILTRDFNESSEREVLEQIVRNIAESTNE